MAVQTCGTCKSVKTFDNGAADIEMHVRACTDCLVGPAADDAELFRRIARVEHAAARDRSARAVLMRLSTCMTPQQVRAYAEYRRG